MILGAVTDWIENWAWDFLHRIFIWVFDRFLYSIVGYLYQVFLIIGTFDLFGGPTTGSTESAMSVYQGFTSRLYNMIGIAMIFVLSYEILLYIINPDKKDQKSSKMVVNLVKSIILIIVLPLAFHYAATIEYHVLVTDNTIWSLVLGTGTSESESASDAGNTMASMVYINMFHPTGTGYSDFYKTDGTMNTVDVACKGFNDTMGSDAYISETTVSRVTKTGVTGAAVGFMIGGPTGALVGGAIGFAVGLFTGSDTDGITACEYYWYILYVSGNPSDASSDSLLKDLSKAKMDEEAIGSSNKATTLTSQTALIDEISDEGTMEYMYFAPIVGVVLVWMLLGYTMDIAYRAFKLAFLQMVSPIPVLIGVLNEDLFNKWKKDILSTYLDIFVRVFVMAFVVLMITLVPSFIEALFSAFGVLDTAPGLLKAVTFIFMVLGLLRFGHDLPDLIKDFTKSVSGKGLLSGMNLNPNKSMKNTFNAAKSAGKPIGAAAGAALGGASSGINAAKRSAAANPKNPNASASERFARFGKIAANGAAGGFRGMVTGGKSGWQSGLSKGGFTNSITNANQAAYKSEQRRNHIWESRKNGIFGTGGMIDVATNGRVGQFARSFDGQNYTRDSEFESAQEMNRVTKAGKNAFYGKKLESVTEELKSQKAEAMSRMGRTGTGGPSAASINEQRDNALRGIFASGASGLEEKFNESMNEIHGTGNGTFTGANGRTYSGSKQDIKSQMLSEINQSGFYDAQVKSAQWSSEQGVLTCDFNGRQYTCDSPEKMAGIEQQMKNDLISTQAAAIDRQLTAGFKEDLSTVFEGQTYNGTREEIASAISDALNKQHAASGGQFTGSFDGVEFTGSMDEVRQQIETAASAAMANAGNSGQFSTTFRGETITGDSAAAVEKAINDKMTEIKKQAAYDAAQSVINGTGGIDLAQIFATNHEKLTVEYADTLSDTEREIISKACSEALGGGTSDLAQALGIGVHDAGNVDKVMSQISSDDFKEAFSSLDDDAKKAIAGELGKLFKDVIDADDKVVKQIQSQHDLYTGVSTNRFTGQDENSLATGGGKGGKKDDKK